MNFIKQIKTELVNLIKTRFILIIGILVLIIGFAGPILSHVIQQYRGDDYYGYGSYYYFGESDQEDLNIDGVEITTENPMYSDIWYYSEDLPNYLSDIVEADQLPDAEELVQVTLDYFVKMASEITSYEDYRYSIVWQGKSIVEELYVLETEAEVENKIDFMNAVNSITYIDNMEEMFAWSDAQKAETIEANTAFLESLDKAILDNDFDSYVECMIQVEQMNIEDYQRSIEVQEAAVIANPELEESANAEIERLQQRITVIEESTIPTWEYRREHLVYPDSDDWRNSALDDIEYANYRISDADNPYTEEVFDEDYWMGQQYGDYEDYLEAMEVQKEEAQTDILIAQNSLDSDEPDMKFVSDGARNKVNSNLFYSLIVAFLGIMIGGYLIANEFQAGTVRLLMIRPRTRMKVYGAKYLAGLIYIYMIYLGGMFCNIIVNGMISGFADYGYPNYSASGAVNFWGMILLRIMACSMTIVFSYSFAYALSALIKNAAIAIALPSAAIFGGTIAVSVIAYTSYAKYIEFTPLPYINMSSFYMEYGVGQQLIEKGLNVNVTTGVIVLLVLSLACYFLGAIVFKNTDITN